METLHRCVQMNRNAHLLQPPTEPHILACREVDLEPVGTAIPLRHRHQYITTDQAAAHAYAVHLLEGVPLVLLQEFERRAEVEGAQGVRPLLEEVEARDDGQVVLEQSVESVLRNDHVLIHKQQVCCVSLQELFDYLVPCVVDVGRPSVVQVVNKSLTDTIAK